MGDRLEHEYLSDEGPELCTYCHRDPPPAGTTDECPVLLRAALNGARTRVAALEARPTVHPLAWAYLTTFDGSISGRRTTAEWVYAGYPLTATGGEVLAPGEEP